MPGIDRANLRQWLETEFKEAVWDDERIKEAGAVMKLAFQRGETAEHACRMLITAFVRELVDPLGCARDDFSIQMRKPT